MLATLNSIYQMRINKVHRFRPKIEIHHRMGNFVCKTVPNVQELKRALELRYQVFHREEAGAKPAWGLDIDPYDFESDHLVIIDTRRHVVAGTFRLRSSSWGGPFHSEREFILTRLKKKPGVKLELGRACVHPDYRRGFVIPMLWRGVAEYVVASGAQWVFGRATVPSQSARVAALLYRHFLDEERVASQFFAPPTLAHTIPELHFWLSRFAAPLSEEERLEAKSWISPLFQSFLERSAIICGEPALNLEHQRLDFLAVIERP